MDIKVFSKYEGHTYANPSGDIDPKLKDKKYCIDKTKNVYSLYVNNKCGIPYSYASNFNLIRLYGSGQQPIEIYQNILGYSNSPSQSGIAADGTDMRDQIDSQSREGWHNVRWDIVSPAQKISNKIEDIFDDIDFSVLGTQIDSDSGAEEEDAKWATWVDIKHGTEFNKIKVSIGLPINEQTVPIETYEELQLFEKAGGYKSNYSRIIEKLLKFTENKSRYTKSLKSKLVRDIKDLNVAFVRCYYDEEDNYVKYRYCDPENVIVQYSKYDDFRDSNYFGEVMTMSISELKYKLPEITDEEIASLAKIYVGFQNNPSENEWNKIYKSGSFEGYNSWRVSVLDLEWRENDREYNTIRKNRGGNEFVTKEEYGKVLNTDRRKPLIINKRFSYGCKWVIGSDHAFEYGRVYDQPRDNPRKPLFSFAGVKLNGPSTTVQLMPIFDNLQISWLKYQNTLSIVFEDAWALDLKMLTNVTDGTKTYTLQDQINMWKTQGILPFMSQPAGFSYQGGAITPVHKLPGGMGQRLQESIQMWQSNMQKIEDITGLNSVFLGGMPDPNQPVSSTKMAVNSASSAIKPMINAVFILKSDISNVAAQKIRVLLKHNSDVYKSYAKIVGEKDVELIKQLATEAERFGIELVAMPTEDDRNSLYRDIEIALEAKIIELPDAMLLKQQIRDGEDLREIQNRLAFKTSKQQQMRQRAIQQEAQARMQGETQRDQQKAQMEAMMKKMEIEGELALENVKAENTRKNMLLESNLKYMQFVKEKAAEEQAMEESQNKQVTLR